MCLYERKMENPKYKPNKKNGGIIPPIPHPDMRWVPVTCGECMECRKKKAREWQVRLTEDIKKHKNGKFVTLTFNSESLKIIKDRVRLDYFKKNKTKLEGYPLDNAIATYAIDKFCERWRKKTGKFPRHWLITELGTTRTEHIHMHGIIWADDIQEIVRVWNSSKYGANGFVWTGNEITLTVGGITKTIIDQYVNEKTVNYCMKYVHKIDEKHKTYKPIILCSNGIGKGFTDTEAAKRAKYQTENTREYYKTSSGHKIALPKYLKNKIYSDTEREKLWIEKLNQKMKYVCGEKISIADGVENYEKLRDFYRNKNAILGYGTGMHSDERREYEKQRRIRMQEDRERKTKQKK